MSKENMSSIFHVFALSMESQFDISQQTRKTFCQSKKNRWKEDTMHLRWSQGSAHHLHQKQHHTH